MLRVSNSIQATWCDIFSLPFTSTGIPRFWMNRCQTRLIRSQTAARPLPSKTPPHSSQRSPPHPFRALRISCAKLLICPVTSQCFLHGTQGEISTLLCAVNHFTLPLLRWYDHYSIRRHSNWPPFWVTVIRGGFLLFLFLCFFFFLSLKHPLKISKKHKLSILPHLGRRSMTHKCRDESLKEGLY